MQIILSADTPSLRANFRRIRNAWLIVSDAYMMSDRGLTEEQKQELLAFRVNLRLAPDESTNATLWHIPLVPSFINETVE